MRLASFGKASKPRPHDQQAEGNLNVFQLSALVLLLITLSVFLSLLFAGHAQLTILEYSVGDIVVADVVVPFDLLVLDQAASETRRKVARENVLPVYRYDANQSESLVSRLRQTFARCRTLLNTAETADSVAPLDGKQPSLDSLSPELKEQIRFEVRRIGNGIAGSESLDLLVQERFSTGLEAALVEAVFQAYAQPIVQDEQGLIRDKGSISLVPAPSGEERVVPIRLINTEAQARARAEALIRQGSKLPTRLRSPLQVLVSQIITPNLEYDWPLTEQRQQQAAVNSTPVEVTLKKGKVVVRRGDEIGQSQLDQLQALRSVRLNRLSIRQVSGKALLIASLLLILGYFLRALSQQQWTYWKLILLVSLILVTNFLVLKGFWFVYEAVSRDFVASPFNDKYYFFFALPFAFGAMLLVLLVGERTALIFSIFYSALAGLALETDFYGFLYILMSNVVGNLSVRKAVQRVGIISAGFKLGIAAIGLFIVLQVSKQAPFDPSMGWFGAALSFLSGPLNTGLLIFLLPIFERLFMVTTDIRLLELGNLNLPVIRELILKAPGTYNHSVAVGTLAEGAAKAISLNPVFARVACLYHDIGKSVHPEYFVENQQGVNVHDRISPVESANKVFSHVAEGIRMARAAKLPSNIVDIIPQHHGTRQLAYFLEKAKRQATAEGTEACEEDFRYPGPKPQTRMAAVVMLADAVEASARTLKDHSQDRLLEVIQKIVTSTLEDGQLSECDITLSEIDKIAFSFLATLSSIYHSRIAYPGFDFNQKAVAQTGRR
jgi:putative nucleotidyltransferase with HDIG domain